MYIDYSLWETKEISLNSLNLDLNNPRLNYNEVVLNQTGIINFLIEKEKVYQLAKDISEKGYFAGEDPIVCVENDKYYVLEGNRRVSALKLLQNPEKYLTKSKAKILLNNIELNNINVNKKVKCIVSPNRFLANPIIYSRHKGETLQTWKTGNQYSFIADLIYRDKLTIEEVVDVLGVSRSDVVGPVKACNLFIEGQSILEKKGIYIDYRNFEITNLERFYLYPSGRKFLGISFKDDGALQIDIPYPEFEKRCEYIFKIILKGGFSRVFDKVEDKDAFVKDLELNPIFDFDVKPEKSESISEKKLTEREILIEKNTNTKNKEGKKTPPNFYYIKSDEVLFFDDEKIDILFEELRLVYKKNTYTFSILLRTYLEQVLFMYLTKKGLYNEVGRKQKEKKTIDNKAKITSLVKYLKGLNKEFVFDEDQIYNILKFKSDNSSSSSDSSEYSEIGLKAMLDYTNNNILSKIIPATEFKVQKKFLDNVKEEADLAVHNYIYTNGREMNEKAWKVCYRFFNYLIEDLKKSS